VGTVLRAHPGRATAPVEEADPVDIAEILRHVLVVLVAAKLAAELAERLGIPAVVGEIVAGILVGPSVLDVVHGDEVLRALGEIGVILLLLEVGMEMDLRELSKVGRTSVQVATVGVVVPLVLGFGAMELLGDDVTTSLFVGAALTATSVGITARVFGDLKALATTEARIVLGAAVADDVMGLVVLTVVVRLVTEGSVSVVSVGGIVAVALLFLAVGGAVGLRVAPPLFAAIERVSRSTGTMVALALAFTLAYAELADAAKLAPIVGAFVAGLALSQARPVPRIRRELAPVGHLFIPVFFLQIGIDADVGRFFQLGVLRDAGLLLLVAVVGKLLSPLGALGAPGDKALIGLGMLPRGEVGLIFATLGLQNGVLGSDLYAALLLVVLLSTLLTPPMLKLRYQQVRGRLVSVATPSGTLPPLGGWLSVSRDQVELAARPPDDQALPVALTAAVALGRRHPGAGLLDWLAEATPTLTWDPAETGPLLDLIERGNARSWRFLSRTGVLDRIAPELARALAERGQDGIALDPLESHRFAAVERLRLLDADDPLAIELGRLEHPDRLLLAAFLADALEEDPDPSATARLVLDRLRLPDGESPEVLALLQDRDLLWSAARRPGALTEEPVLQLAAHLDVPERARGLYALSALRPAGRERWEVQRLTALHDLVQAALADDALSGDVARRLVERRRSDAARLLAGEAGALERLAAAPRAYVLRTPAPALARHARLLDPPPVRHPRLAVTPDEGRWRVDVAWQDRPGLLAVLAGVLMAEGLGIDEAVLATWPDGSVLDAFLVTAAAPIDADRLAGALAHAAAGSLEVPPMPDAEVDLDQVASPWHTVCEVRMGDRPGALAAIATALAAAGVEVRSAAATTHDGLAIDRFEVTDRTGGKVDDAVGGRLATLLREGATVRRRRWGRKVAVRSGSG
jgi:Kef-type K+ transport system membrane component KefB